MTTDSPSHDPCAAPIFGSGFDSAEAPTEIESLCMSCFKNGTTRLLFINIPFFREIIVSAFECPHCFSKNSEVQSGGAVQELGCKQTLRVLHDKDLDRQIVKSDNGVLSIPEIDFEIPARSQKGMLTTVEGILKRTIEGLSQDQEYRRQKDPEAAEKIDQFIKRVDAMANREALPFTIILDDCSGNSFIQNHLAPLEDVQLLSEFYHRTKQMNIFLGLLADDEEEEEEGVEGKGNQPVSYSEPHLLSAEEAENFLRKLKPKVELRHDTEKPDAEEILTMPCHCTCCGLAGEIRMHIMDIPHFKEVILMAFTCSRCGYRTNEVKAGGAIAEKGKKHVLRVESLEDLSRDILKSDTAGLEIPEIDLIVVPGSLGGRFTTVEGLLTQIAEQLSQNSFSFGDSSEQFEKSRYRLFLDDFQALIRGEKPFTLLMDDPVGNSYVQNIYAPDPDPQLEIKEYERNFEQNETLGLNDINTESYHPN